MFAVRKQLICIGARRDNAAQTRGRPHERTSSVKRNLQACPASLCLHLLLTMRIIDEQRFETSSAAELTALDETVPIFAQCLEYSVRGFSVGCPQRCRATSAFCPCLLLAAAVYRLRRARIGSALSLLTLSGTRGALFTMLLLLGYAKYSLLLKKA